MGMDLSTRMAIKSHIDRFGNPVKALNLTVGLFVALLMVYLLFITFSTKCEKCDSDISSLVYPDESSVVTLVFNNNLLLQRFKQDKLKTAIEQAEKLLNAQRPMFEQSRKELLNSYAGLACDISITTKNMPAALQKQAAKIKVMPSTSMLKNPQSVDCGELNDSQISIISGENTMVIAQQWFAQQAKNGLLNSRQMLAADEAADMFTQQLQQEQRLLERIVNAFKLEIDSTIHFNFVRGDYYQWIVHLTFISWFGVLISTLAAIVNGLVNKSFSGLVMVLMFPKFITAPVIAIVFVATIIYGLSSEDIVLTHPAMFIIFAFMTGYMSESFNLMLREGLNRLLPSFGIDASKLKQSKERILAS
jgi:hypothetical protein